MVVVQQGRALQLDDHRYDVAVIVQPLGGRLPSTGQLRRVQAGHIGQLNGLGPRV